MQANVDSSYKSVVIATLVDVDTDIKYEVKFDNDKTLWSIQIFGSPEADMELEEKQKFMKSDEIVKLIKAASYHLERAKKVYNGIVKSHLEDGDLMKVDPIKLGRILELIDSKIAMGNLRAGKFVM